MPEDGELIEIKNANEVDLYSEARSRQEEKLSRLKEEAVGASASGSSGNSQADNRMEYLMRQSEVFAHFITSDASGEVKKTFGKGKKSGRMTEESEDKVLLSQANAKTQVVRLTKQPNNVKNNLNPAHSMRPYQIEGT